MSWLKALYHSFPIQLVLLHVKKFQVLLLFWAILFSTIEGGFMQSFGADALFLFPEYLGRVNLVSSAIVGAALGIFVMSWNITSFILFSRHFRFLATTTNPFVKYCLNNCLVPAAFLLLYLVRCLQFDQNKELLSLHAVGLLLAGFWAGFGIVVALTLLYFDQADHTITRTMTPLIHNPEKFKSQFRPGAVGLNQSRLIRVEWYLSTPVSIKKVRDVSHYSREFIESIFNRHHFSAILSIFVAFIFLICVGFFMDNPLFQLPAAASILIFFAILISVSGAFTYFLQSWSIPFLLALLLVLNFLFTSGIIDPTNKAYGLDYSGQKPRPRYDRATLLDLCSPARMHADEQAMLQVLEKWKARQGKEKPILFFVNTSGGGSRSAAFTMNVLQELDRQSAGSLMQRTFLISGASGGMFAASYFRELSRLKEKTAPRLDLHDPKYVEAISKDMLNPLFSSFIARDLASPAQRFSVDGNFYVKDRGYAFEQRLGSNTEGVLDKQLSDLREDESQARCPLMIFNSVITRDSRTLMISTQPISFLMRPQQASPTLPASDPDAIDFCAYFKDQQPLHLRLLTALRMNATFPYVLPNVWLPTDPVIDVMDAGFRDNFGEQTAIRFIQVFRQWIQANTSGVVLLQIRDRKTGGWENPYESKDISEIFTKPFLLLQHNWYKMQDYTQNDMLNLVQAGIQVPFSKIVFQYEPKHASEGAALNFHLTRSEQADIAAAIHQPDNVRELRRAAALLRP